MLINQAHVIPKKAETNTTPKIKTKVVRMYLGNNTLRKCICTSGSVCEDIAVNKTLKIGSRRAMLNSHPTVLVIALGSCYS